MQLKLTTMSRRSATLAMLLAVTLLATVVIKTTNAEEVVEFEDDDGVVEDVQEDPSTAAGEEELVYESPKFDPKKFHFVDHFDNIDESRKKWIKSRAKKDDTAEEIAKYDGVWEWESPHRIVWKKDSGLVLKSKAKHAAIAAKLTQAFVFQNKPLVVQYEVTMQEGQECGGSYIKLLSAGKQSEDLANFNDKTPYTIMFGPDKCGNDIKMHFIFRHLNPINGSISEKHCRKPKERLEEPFKDKLPHLYTLVVRPDNTYEIRVDHKIINEGSLLEDFTPPVNPPREIDDPNDSKPIDWDEREKIPDPTAQKPEDWDDDAPPQIPDPTAVKPDGWLEDEVEMIPDPSANKPDDWDAEIDGEWEAPLVDNPVCEKAVGCGKWKAPLIPNQEYKGKWRAPLIDNPNYQGKWAARKIPNPHFFEDLLPFRMTPIDAVGLELWSMSSDILFDNLIITDDYEVARDFATKSFDLKRKYIDKESKTLWHRLMRHMNYKPGWWALYFIYLLIPASCYVYYLYKRAKEEETILKKITSYVEENPLVWKIAVVLIVAAIAYNLYRMTTKRSAAKKDLTGSAKKTDAPQPDDDDVDNKDADELQDDKANELQDDKAAGDGLEKNASVSPKKKKKSDLDVKDDAAAAAFIGGVRDGTSREKSVNETPETTTDELNAKATRKRQVRKD